MTASPIEHANARTAGTLVGLLGIEITELDGGLARGRLVIRPELLAPNGYLHAGTVVTFADTISGYGCIHN